MFDIGFAELFLLSAIALLVLGPERLPVAMYVLGRWVAKWRRSFNELREEFEREVPVEAKQMQHLQHTDWRRDLGASGELENLILPQRPRGEEPSADTEARYVGDEPSDEPSLPAGLPPAGRSSH